MHANLELTRLCNQRCVYCFNDSGPERVNARADIDWAGAIETLSRRGFRSVHFTGGEPFLVTDLLRLMRAALDRKLGISVLSNGHGVPRILEDQAGRNVLAKLQVAQISLDSMDRAMHDRRRGKAGAWTSADAAIRALSQARISTEISCVVDDENEDGIEALATFAREQGANLILRPRVRAGRAADKQPYVIGERLRTVLNRFKHLLTDDRFHYVPRDGGNVGAPRGVVTLTADGEVRGDLTLFPERTRFGRDGGILTA
jgi:MoaA/NifB/PqqE/SkfB family radical SAM enzyme